MLGLGHSLVGGSLLDSVYSMTKSFQFDGTDDIFLTNTLSGTDPADGTAKPITKSLSVAAWIKVDDGSADPYATDASKTVVSCNFNGGWRLHYQDKRFYGHVSYVNGDGSNISHSMGDGFNKAKNPTSGTDYNRYLYRSDGWHLMVMTADMENNDTAVITNLYVDGNRAQSGATGQDGSSGVAQYGSLPESSNSKKTTNASGGDITMRYDTSTSDVHEIDITIGAIGNFTAATNVTSFRAVGFQGLIGDVAIWEDVVLTQDDIANLYNLHVPMDMSTIQSSKLVGHWRPTKGLDDSVSGATGTLVDDSAVVTDSPSLDVSGYYGYR